VILLLPTRPDAAPPAALAQALNLPEVGEQLNRMCGSASIPARLLEQVPLPAVAIV
jgi:adenine-specific DNA-methyltransferase